ncbi:MAG: 2,3-bisphosphoglycerate-independent phosphoglycerate mutase [Anaerolineales bacterium]
MANFDLIRELQFDNGSKIVLLIMDGLGGMPMEPGGPTELEAARTPTLDRLAAEGTIGQTIPIRPGITPGSGPAHLALFGYDPVEHEVGRGVLEATGVGLHVHEGDVAARGNFCTLDSQGKISDRRAGRIPTEEAIPIVKKLSGIKIPGLDIEVEHVKEYRFALILRGEDLHPDIEDTDPQRTGLAPLKAKALNKQSKKAAEYVQQWVDAAQKLLADEPKANGVTLRGFSSDPQLPKFPEIYGLRSGCIAVYPMYRGVARLVGMDIIEFEGDTPEEEFATAARHWDDYDFFFIHIKKTDSRGEDGDFNKKAEVIESVDRALDKLLDLKPDVLAVTGDHSTPASMRTHSWHPVPFLLWAPKHMRPDHQTEFGDRACQLGGLGTMPASDVMPLLMAHAGRLQKFGA